MDDTSEDEESIYNDDTADDTSENEESIYDEDEYYVKECTDDDNGVDVEWVYFSKYKEWVPASKEAQYRHYKVLQQTLIRAFKRFVHEHAQNIDDLLYKPPHGLIPRKHFGIHSNTDRMN